uniref:Trypsin n=1 Tax=Propylea japonica TaxID=158624 RepID=A0A5J6XX80_9CUCU|nr:trypsin [Propylea japonica]
MVNKLSFVALFIAFSFGNGLVIPEESLVPVEHFPFIVSIQENGQQFCTGSLISSRYVLTSASCFDFIDTYDMQFIRVIAGANRPNEEGLPRKIVGYSIHPKHSNTKVTYDAVLIELIGDYAFTDKIYPASLVGETFEISPGARVNITGYSLNQDDSAPKILRNAVVEIIETKACQESWAKQTIHDQLLCAGNSEENIGSGDGGAPMTNQGDLVGYASVQSENGGPSLFTKISSIRPWIKEITGV